MADDADAAAADFCELMSALYACKPLDEGTEEEEEVLVAEETAAFAMSASAEVAEMVEECTKWRRESRTGMAATAAATADDAALLNTVPEPPPPPSLLLGCT